jgi:hypothetical protein
MTQTILRRRSRFHQFALALLILLLLPAGAAATAAVPLISAELPSARPELEGTVFRLAGADHGFIAVWSAAPEPRVGELRLFARRYDREGRPIDPTAIFLGFGTPAGVVWSGSHWIVLTDSWAGSSLLRVSPSPERAVEGSHPTRWRNVYALHQLQGRVVVITELAVEPTTVLSPPSSISANVYDNEGAFLFSRTFDVEGMNFRTVTSGDRLVLFRNQRSSGAFSAVEITSDGEVSPARPLGVIESEGFHAASTGSSYVIISSVQGAASVPPRLQSRSFDSSLQPVGPPHDLGHGWVVRLTAEGATYQLLKQQHLTRTVTTLDAQGSPVASHTVAQPLPEILTRGGAGWIGTLRSSGLLSTIFLDPQFAPVGEPVPVHVGLAFHETPVAAAAGDLALVGWPEPAAGDRKLMRAALLDADGALVGAPLTLGTSGRFPRLSVVAADSGWLVWWRDPDGSNAHAVRIGRDGAAIDEAPLSLGSVLAATSDGGRFILLSGNGEGDRNIRGAALPVSGASSTEPLFHLDTGNAPGELVAAWDGAQLIVAWNECTATICPSDTASPLFYAIVSSDGVVTPARSLGAAGWSLAAGAGAAGTLVTWRELSLHGAVIDRHGINLHGGGGVPLYPQLTPWTTASTIVPFESGWLLTPLGQPVILQLDEQLRPTRFRRVGTAASDALTLISSETLEPRGIFREPVWSDPTPGVRRIHHQGGLMEGEPVDLSSHFVTASTPGEGGGRLVITNHSGRAADGVTVEVSGTIRGRLLWGSDWDCAPFAFACRLRAPLAPFASLEVAVPSFDAQRDTVRVAVSSLSWDPRPEDNFVSVTPPPPPAPARRRGASR